MGNEASTSSLSESVPHLIDTSVHRHPAYRSVLVRAPYRNCLTVLSGFLLASGRFKDRKCMDSGMTFAVVKNRVIAFAAGLVSIGLNAGDRVVLCMETTDYPSLIIADLACQSLGLISVTIDAELDKEEQVEQADLVEAKLVVCSRQFVDIFAPACKTLLAIVEVALVPEARNVGIDVFTFPEVEEEGSSSQSVTQFPLIEPKPEMEIYIAFTSGTEGKPKPVSFTHANVVAGIAGLLRSGPFLTFEGETPTLLSLCSLSSMRERALVYLAIIEGAYVAFGSRSVLTAREIITKVRPTVLSTYPGVLSHIASCIEREMNDESSSSLLTRSLFPLALSLKRSLTNTDPWDSPVWDSLLFHSFKPIYFGNDLSSVVISHGHLREREREIVRGVGCCAVVDSYEVNECAGALSLSLLESVAGERGVGAPSPAVEISLSERGDVMVRGPAVGKYISLRGKAPTEGENEEEEEEGEREREESQWLKTGDLGRWLPDGSLSLCGRSRSLITLSTKHTVAPARVETALSSLSLFTRVIVFGERERERDFVMALCFVAEDFAERAKEHGGEIDPSQPLSSLLQSDEAVSLSLSLITARSTESSLSAWETPRAVSLVEGDLSPECLSLFGEVKRERAYERYKSRITYALQKADFDRKMAAQGLLKNLEN